MTVMLEIMTWCVVGIVAAAGGGGVAFSGARRNRRIGIG